MTVCSEWWVVRIRGLYLKYNKFEFEVTDDDSIVSILLIRDNFKF